MLKMHVNNVKEPVPFYSLDVIISVGYRVKSKRGVEFRRWANSVLRQYILQGYAVKRNRIKQLGEVIRIMKRTGNELEGRQVLSVIEKYNEALDCRMHTTTRPCPARRATKPSAYSPTRSAWKLSGRCGSATNRTCSEGKRTTPLQKASETMFLYFLDKSKALFCDGRK